MSTALWQHPLMATLEDGALRPGGLALTQKTYDKLGITAATNILDAGCGNGTTGAFLKQQYGAQVTGLDLSYANTQQTSLRSVPVLQGSIDNLPFCDAAFDVVNCDCVLSLSHSLQDAVTECSRVLCTGGMLLLSDLYRRTDQQQAHRTCHTAPKCVSQKSISAGCASSPLQLNQLFAVLRKAGFTHTCSTDCTKELKELTAKLIFSGIATCCSDSGNPETRHTARYDKSIGYIQIRAVKKG